MLGDLRTELRGGLGGAGEWRLYFGARFWASVSSLMYSFSVMARMVSFAVLRLDMSEEGLDYFDELVLWDMGVVFEDC